VLIVDHRKTEPALKKLFQDFSAQGGQSQTQAQENPFSLDALRKLNTIYHSFAANNIPAQESGFHNPLWQIFDTLVEASGNLSSTVATIAKAKKVTGPIITGPKDGVDLMINIDPKTNTLESTTFHRGGMGANIAQSTVDQGLEPAYISFAGNDKKSQIQESFLLKGKVSPSFVRTQQASFIHPSINRGKEEFWLVPKRTGFQESEINQYESLIKDFLNQNPAKPLVLCSMPYGCDSEFAQRIVDCAELNQNPVVFNPKEFEFQEEKNFIKSLFETKKINLVKPNFNELLQFLEFDDKVDPKDLEQIRNELREQKNSGDFANIKYFAQMILRKFNIGAFLLSLGDKGAMFVTKEKAFYVPALLVDFQCGSGAGDAGLAAALKFLIDNNLKIESLTSDQSENLLSEFVYAAAATVAKPGNELATKQEIDILKERERVIVHPLSTLHKPYSLTLGSKVN
jgi:fructose-1-phosphate kinase PfkB-like protein